MISKEKLILLIFSFWLLSFYLTARNFLSVRLEEENPSHMRELSHQISTRLDDMVKEVRDLKAKNFAMLNMVRNATNNIQGIINQPEKGYEEIRRALTLDLQEMWYNIRSQKDKLNESHFSQLHDIYTTLQRHAIKLREKDGYEAFRKKETTELSNLVQGRLTELQNPKNCTTAKKLVCYLDKECGFGCQIHHVSYCLIVAYATGRTLILASKNWRYNKNGWEQVFLPLSNNCVTTGRVKPKFFNYNQRQDSLVLLLPLVDFLNPTPNYLPVSVPADISDRIEKVHGEPHIWWVGQFVKYLLRLQPYYKAIVDDYISKSGLTFPTVGIHVRRTDKIISEARFYSVDEYMVHAKEHFEILEKVHGSMKRRVFLASDDPTAIIEAQERYSTPAWKIIGNVDVAKSAALDHRNSVPALIGIIKDIFALSSCDFLVCTFSSQVCRLAYELMQTHNVDASGRFVSLDSGYYFGGGKGLIELAVLPHSPRNEQEIELKVGDKVKVAGNHWNGISEGINQRTLKAGFYPSYKTKYSARKVNFPEIQWWD